MSDGLVSVIIPTYNRAGSVCCAIDSIKAQTYNNWEAVVVDDGSTDDTLRTIALHYGNDKRVRYIYQANGGAASARNRGLAMVRGSYIAFLDSDDTWEPWKLALQMACFRREPEMGMVWTNMMALDETGNVSHPRYLEVVYRARREYRDEELFDRFHAIRDFAPKLSRRLPNARLATGNIFSQMVTGNIVQISAMVLRRDWQERIGLFNPEYTPVGDDYDFHLRVCRMGRVGFVDVSSIRYQTGKPDQLSDRKYSIVAARNFLRVVEPIIRDERQSIHLPDKTLRRTLSFGNRWYGEELLLAGQRTEARARLLTSLGYKCSLEGLGFYGLALLPASVMNSIRSVRRAFKSHLKSVPHSNPIKAVE